MKEAELKVDLAVMGDEVIGTIRMTGPLYCHVEFAAAQGPVDGRVMPPGDMLPMENAQGQKFALKFNPEHRQHGWVFYDNHGQWVTLRRALPHEIERAKSIIEMREVLAGIPCKA